MLDNVTLPCTCCGSGFAKRDGVRIVTGEVAEWRNWNRMFLNDWASETVTRIYSSKLRAGVSDVHDHAKPGEAHLLMRDAEEPSCRHQ